MRKLIVFIAALLLCVVTAFAHSGGTDRNGGHYNRTTGEYHYHHGYPEHQHTNGICPYDRKTTATANAGNVSNASSKDDDGSFPVGLLAGAGGASAAFWLFGRKKT